MKKILIVFGTRPEAIKMAPLVKEFEKQPSEYDTQICVTAQHREMLDQVLDFFEIRPDFDLDLMKPNQNLHSLTAEIIVGMKSVISEVNPDFVFVHGDTTTSMAVALASFYSGTKVCHVEAGLRTYDKHSPWPEELNRQLTGRISDYHFSPTETSKLNLLNEKVETDSIVVTGNTVIDALFFAVEKVRKCPPSIHELTKMDLNVFTNGKGGDLGLLEKLLATEPQSQITEDIILVTGHRRENHGQALLNICNGLLEITEKSNAHIVFPVHLNPNVRGPVCEILGNSPRVTLMEPLNYKAFVWLMDKAKIIITDSGGVQEEAPSLGKPVLVIRDTTERPEAVGAKTVVLVGTDKDKIVTETLTLLNNEQKYNEMVRKHNPYGDGNASMRIVDYISAL